MNYIIIHVLPNFHFQILNYPHHLVTEIDKDMFHNTGFGNCIGKTGGTEGWKLHVYIKT